jgi:uncharacterized protein with GYD domain
VLSYNKPRRVLMPKFLLEPAYTADGTKRLVKEGGTSRRKTVEKMVKELHGKLEAFYFAFGTSDVILIVDLPDAVTAAALSLVVNQSGAVHLKTHVLITPRDGSSIEEVRELPGTWEITRDRHFPCRQEGK